MSSITAAIVISVEMERLTTTLRKEAFADTVSLCVSDRRKPGICPLIWRVLIRGEVGVHIRRRRIGQRTTPELIPLLHLQTINGFFVKNHVQYEFGGRNIPLKIYKGSLENREDSHVLQVSVVGNIDKNETSADKTWLDYTNYQCRVEEQIAREMPSAETDEMFIRVSISEDEFELVMGLLEILTGPKLQQELPDFSFFKPFFLALLRPDTFASHIMPAWIQPPSVLSSIALTIHPHWHQRRLLRGGRKIFPSLNSEENDYINAAYVCFRNIPIRRTWAQNLKVGKRKVGRLQADSSAHLANEREKLKKASPRRSQRLKPERVQQIQGRAGKEPSCATPDDETKVPVGSGVPETATQNGTPNAQPSIKHKVSGTRTMKSHTHNHSVTATEQTTANVINAPAHIRHKGPKEITRPAVEQGRNVDGQNAHHFSHLGVEHIPSLPQKSGGDGMLDSLKGDEAPPSLIHIPVQTTDTKTSRQPHDHGPARNENNSFTIDSFTGRFAFPPALLEGVQGPLRDDGTNSTSVRIDPETNPVDMAQMRMSICFGLAGRNGTGRAYAYGVSHLQQ
ncbi:hypothetical protein B0H13DRAFT_2561701 [Mycena leptocephala]|nr:hypothetical protein B0H13DRAFT_2561701 [Mycena leptocephala]